MTRRSRWVRAWLLTGALLGSLLVTAFGYEMAKGSPNPAKTLLRRADTALRHHHVLPRDLWFAYEAGQGGMRFSDDTHTTFEVITSREPVYALGVWPVGMHYSAREVSHDGPLECSGVRLVWWSGTERHVVDTADRANGRLPEGATSVGVRGWIPFEASRYGVEELGTSFAPTTWREAWSDGWAD